MHATYRFGPVVLVILVAVGALGCGVPQVFSSCLTPVSGTCTDDYNPAGIETQTDTQQTCANVSGTWSGGSCNRNGALGGCKTYTRSGFGIIELTLVTWYWRGADLGGKPALTVQDLIDWCGGDFEYPDGTTPPPPPPPDAGPAPVCTPVPPGAVGDAGPGPCVPQPDSQWPNAQTWCGNTTGGLQGPLSGVVEVSGGNGAPVNIIDFHMDDWLGPVGILQLRCGAFVPGTYTDAMLYGEFTLTTYGTDGSSTEWTVQNGQAPGCNLPNECGALPPGSVTLVLTSVGPPPDPTVNASPTRGTLTMLLSENGGTGTATLRAAF